MKYIYTIKNIKFILLKKHLMSERHIGMNYILAGTTGTGKTLYLKSVFTNTENQVKWLTSENIVDMIIEKVANKTKEIRFDEQIIIIENIESLYGKVCIIESVKKLIFSWNNMGKTVILTTNKREILKEFDEKFKVYNMFKGIRVFERLKHYIIRRYTISRD